MQERMAPVQAGGGADLHHDERRPDEHARRVRALLVHAWRPSRWTRLAYRAILTGGDVAGDERYREVDAQHADAAGAPFCPLLLPGSLQTGETGCNG